jgi:hypothetical protein
MPDANTADFFGGGSFVPPTVKPPPRDVRVVAKERAQVEANKQRQIEAQRIASNERVKARKLADQKWQRDYEARMQADPGPEGQAWRARQKKIKSAGVDWGLIPMGATVIGTGAAVIATGGAVAGALGVTAAASTAAAATTASQAISAATKTAKTAGAIGRGNVGRAVGVASTALDTAGVKTPPLPSAAKVGGEAMAGLGVSVPKVKVALPSAKDAVKKAKAKAKQTAKSAVKTAAKAAKKTATQAVKAAAKPATVAAKAAVAAVKPAAKPAALKPKPVSTASILKPTAAKPLSLMGGKGVKPTAAMLFSKPPTTTPPGVATKPPAAAKPPATAAAKPAASKPATKGKPQRGIFIPLNGVLDLKTREWVAAG